ncbi:MAG: hypothetical protein HOJ16_00510 [Candidatus Peribacter sp.]|jgi:hypothetical protein|nr:hypothetical protein [Candidatus Peribacter sp.]
MNDLETFIANSIKNIKDDRAATKTLLTNLMKYMMVTEERHEKVGMIAAKYVETLQRSNEQLVKLTAILQKQVSRHEGITDKEKDELFDLIQLDDDEAED